MVSGAFQQTLSRRTKLCGFSFLYASNQLFAFQTMHNVLNTVA